MTGDHDDRVVPLHSHKFTATLQRAQRGSAPILTRIETQTGHGMGKPAAMVAAELADMLAFAAHFTGLQVPPAGVGSGGDDPIVAEVRVLPDRPSLGRAAAAAIVDTLKAGLQRSDRLRVVFAAAPSQQETLEAVVAADGVDWSRIDAFHMDEYLGLPDDHPSGFGNWLGAHLFDRLPFGSVHLIRPGDDPERAAAEYAALLAEQPIDLVVCGIGENGHIAFNDPPVADFADPLDVKIVTLDDACRHQQVGDGAFASFGDVPTRAITLTVPRLLRAEAIVCVVPGANKRQAVTDALLGPVTTACPASILRTRANVRLFLDQDSGADVAAR
jgi:glucosamine-6-phosphate deaminase